MLDFFRQPGFWGLFCVSGAAMMVNGIFWAAVAGGRRPLAMLFLGVGIALTVVTGFEHGVAAAIVVGVTGVVLGAIGLEIGGERTPRHAVVVDTAPANDQIKLAS
jgi:hypothetical protein